MAAEPFSANRLQLKVEVILPAASFIKLPSLRMTKVSPDPNNGIFMGKQEESDLALLLAE